MFICMYIYIHIHTSRSPRNTRCKAATIHRMLSVIGEEYTLNIVLTFLVVSEGQRNCEDTLIKRGSLTITLVDCEILTY